MLNLQTASFAIYKLQNIITTKTSGYMVLVQSLILCMNTFLSLADDLPPSPMATPAAEQLIVAITPKNFELEVSLSQHSSANTRQAVAHLSSMTVANKPSLTAIQSVSRSSLGPSPSFNQVTISIYKCWLSS